MSVPPLTHSDPGLALSAISTAARWTPSEEERVDVKDLFHGKTITGQVAGAIAALSRPDLHPVIPVQTTLLCGRGGSGKTTVLAAIASACSCPVYRCDMALFSRFPAKQWAQVASLLFELAASEKGRSLILLDNLNEMCEDPVLDAALTAQLCRYRLPRNVVVWGTNNTRHHLSSTMLRRFDLYLPLDSPHEDQQLRFAQWWLSRAEETTRKHLARLGIPVPSTYRYHLQLTESDAKVLSSRCFHTTYAVMDACLRAASAPPVTMKPGQTLLDVPARSCREVILSLEREWHEWQRHEPTETESKKHGGRKGTSRDKSNRSPQRREASKETKEGMGGGGAVADPNMKSGGVGEAPQKSSHPPTPQDGAIKCGTAVGEGAGAGASFLVVGGGVGEEEEGEADEVELHDLSPVKGTTEPKPV
jgi:hypothetical protein